MIDQNEINRAFLTFDADRPVTAEGFEQLLGGAVARAHATSPTWSPADRQDMTAVALMFAIRHWRMRKQSAELFWPIADEETTAFCWNLLFQMSEIDPEGPFRQLRFMVAERGAVDFGKPEGDTASMAFYAGFALGVDGGSAKGLMTTRSQMNDLLLSYTQARKEAAENRRSTLLTFAAAMIESDPHVSTAEIAREFRKVHRPTSALSTDLEDREVSAWRRAGVLPERVLRKIANKSG